jgi:hypothetical protein
MPDTIFNPKTGRMEPVAAGPDIMGLLKQFAENQDLARDDRGPVAPPPMPGAPAMFRPQAPQPPDVGALMRRISGGPSAPADAAPGGGGGGGGRMAWAGASPSAGDLAGERDDFLSRGSSPEIGMMADALEGRRLADENLANRPDLMEAERGKYAMQGLRRAATQGDFATQMADPAYRREQAADDAVSSAQTYMDPTVAAARTAETNADVSHQEAMQRLAIRLGIDPAVLAQKSREFEQQKTLHTIDAQGHMGPFGSLLMGGGAGASGGAAGSVKMRAPDGSVRDVPHDQVEHFRSLGAQVVQ